MTSVSEHDFHLLDSSDRCDSCGAQAYVMVQLRESGLPLAFCGHHWNRHSGQLAPLIEDMIDETDRLLSR
jgi:hypothetical protein